MGISGDRETIEQARIRALYAYSLLNAANGGSFMGEREALLLASEELSQALKLTLAARGKKVELIEAEVATVRPTSPPTSLAALDEGRTWIPPTPRARDGNAGAMKRPTIPATAVPSWARCACGAQAQVNAAVCAKCAASAAASGAPLCGCGAPNGGDPGDLCEECADAVTEFDLPTAGELAAEAGDAASAPLAGEG